MSSKKKNAQPLYAESGVSELTKQSQQVVAGLKSLYFDTVKPLEEQFNFNEFHTSPLAIGDFDAKPTVLLIGQYSTGKTSFIRYIIGREFPGARVGPEPTTDRFMAVMHGEQERVIPGNAAASQVDRPWTGLQQFGVDFLNRFECSELISPVLQEMTFIDSPGILSGEKQRLQRGYDFSRVCRWFAERADKILLLFDAHKLDISDELKRVIESISFAHNKISVVLNKADMIGHQELMRVYGALMWSLGKVINTPEVTRVYVSSFWDNAKKDHPFVALFDQERKDLLRDLRLLPKSATMSKVNEIVKRCRVLKVHICIISHLKDQMPSFMGKAKKSEYLIENLDQVFVEVQRKHALAVGDFPNLEIFREKLRGYDMSKFSKMNVKRIQSLEQVLTIDIPNLIKVLSTEAKNKEANPFDDVQVGMLDTIENSDRWAVATEFIEKAEQSFTRMTLNAEGRAPGSSVRTELEKTGLPTKDLRQVWNLASLDGLGSLDKEELAIAFHLTSVVMAGKPLPSTLPLALIPPSRRSSPLYRDP